MKANEQPAWLKTLSETRNMLAAAGFIILLVSLFFSRAAAVNNDGVVLQVYAARNDLVLGAIAGMGGALTLLISLARTSAWRKGVSACIWGMGAGQLMVTAGIWARLYFEGIQIIPSAAYYTLSGSILLIAYAIGIESKEEALSRGPAANTI